MTVKINGTNTAAAPGYAGDDADTGLQCGTNELKLVTGGSARATVDSSGNFGIGTASPGSFNSDGRNLVVGTGSGGQGMSIYSGSSSYGTIYFADGTSGSALYQGGILYNHNSNFLRFDRAGAEGMRLTTAGLTFNGDTSSVNALDDYEEGSWTPTLAYGSTSATLHAQTAGRYTKIGNKVTIQFYIRQTARNTSTGNIQMSSLPFSEGSSLSYNLGMVQGDSGINMPAGAGSIMTYVEGANVRFLYQGNTGHADITASHVADATGFYGFATYFTS